MTTYVTILSGIILIDYFIIQKDYSWYYIPALLRAFNLQYLPTESVTNCD